MSITKQIFQTDNKLRWKTFQWLRRFFIFTIVLMVPVVLITLARGVVPNLPLLINDTDSIHHIANPVMPADLNSRELKKYKGFEAYLVAKEKNQKLKNRDTAFRQQQLIRAAFYVDWDPQSFFSLQKNIDKLNMIMPEWFFIDPATDTLRADIDVNALKLMKKKNLKIIPLINNINDKINGGGFDGNILHSILHNTQKRKRLIDDIVKYIQQYQLQGINIDFEEFKESSDAPIVAFQKELYERLHPLQLLVTQDIMAYNRFAQRKIS